MDVTGNSNRISDPAPLCQLHRVPFPYCVGVLNRSIKEFTRALAGINHRVPALFHDASLEQRSGGFHALPFQKVRRAWLLPVRPPHAAQRGSNILGLRLDPLRIPR